MNMVKAVLAAFIQQWKYTASSIMNLSFLIGNIPTVVVIAWITIRSGNPDVLTYLVIGAPLAGMWNGVIFRVGWSLSSELSSRTLEFAMISKTPMMLTMLGKSLAQLVYGIPTAIVSLIAMLIVVRQIPSISNVPLFLVSLVMVVIGILVTSMLFSPLMVLVGGRAGFFNAIMAFGVMISGFMFPIDQLPAGLEVIAKLLPTSWAMSGIWNTVTGNASLLSTIGTWGACLLSSAALYALTFLMFKAVEKRIRVTGVLGTY